MTSLIWTLNPAPIGRGYIRLVLDQENRFFGFGAYSIALQGEIETAQNSDYDLEIPSGAGKIVVDYLNRFTDSTVAYTPITGQTAIFDQWIYGTDNTHFSTFRSCAGPSGVIVASGDTTVMEWESDPVETGFTHTGFSFLAPAPLVFHEVEIIPVRERITPEVGEENQWIFYGGGIQVEFESGLGLSAGQGSDPLCELRWSDDGGHTWSNWHALSLGRMGQYKYRTRLQRMGRSRGRKFHVRVSDPVKSNLLRAILVNPEKGLS